jgi:hypothetical protein
MPDSDQSYAGLAARTRGKGYLSDVAGGVADMTGIPQLVGGGKKLATGDYKGGAGDIASVAAPWLAGPVGKGIGMAAEAAPLTAKALAASIGAYLGLSPTQTEAVRLSLEDRRKLEFAKQAETQRQQAAEAEERRQREAGVKAAEAKAAGEALALRMKAETERQQKAEDEAQATALAKEKAGRPFAEQHPEVATTMLAAGGATSFLTPFLGSLRKIGLNNQQIQKWYGLINDAQKSLTSGSKDEARLAAAQLKAVEKNWPAMEQRISGKSPVTETVLPGFATAEASMIPQEIDIRQPSDTEAYRQAHQFYTNPQEWMRTALLGAGGAGLGKLGAYEGKVMGPSMKLPPVGESQGAVAQIGKAFPNTKTKPPASPPQLGVVPKVPAKETARAKERRETGGYE